MVHPALVGGIVAGAAVAAILTYLYVEKYYLANPYVAIPEEIDLEFSESEPEDEDALDRFAKRMGLRQRRRGQRQPQRRTDNTFLREKYSDLAMLEDEIRRRRDNLERERNEIENKERELELRRSVIGDIHASTSSYSRGPSTANVSSFDNSSTFSRTPTESNLRPKDGGKSTLVLFPSPNIESSVNQGVENYVADSDIHELHLGSSVFDDERYAINQPWSSHDRKHQLLDEDHEYPSEQVRISTDENVFDIPTISDESTIGDRPEDITSPFAPPLEGGDEDWTLSASESLTGSISMVSESPNASVIALSESLAGSIAALEDNTVTDEEEEDQRAVEILAEDNSDVRIPRLIISHGPKSEDSWSDVGFSPRSEDAEGKVED